MSRLSIVLVVCAFAAAVVSGSRLESKGGVCSVTETVGHPQYGISFQYETAGECLNSQCNVFKFMSSELPKIVSGNPGDDGKCVCTGNGQEILQGRPGKNGKCGTAWCWDLYSFLLRKEYYKTSDPGEWLTSPNHWRAQCQDGGTSIPSIADFKAGKAGPGAGMVPEAKMDGSDMKDERGMIQDDDEVLEDLEIEEDEEGSLEQEEIDCPELASVVSNTAARVEAETRTIENYRTIITALEIEVPEIETMTKTHEKQKVKYQEFFSRILKTEGSRTCSITERLEDEGFGVSFAYGMTRGCSKILCNQHKFFNDELKHIVKGSEQNNNRCACTLDKQDMFSFKFSKFNPCSAKGCWKFYTSIRNIARKHESGEYPDAGKSLNSVQHFDANCDPGAVTKIPSPADVAQKLVEQGNTDAAKEILKMVQLDEAVEEELFPGETFQSEDDQDNLADEQKNTCILLAEKLAKLEEILRNQEGVSFIAHQRESELSGTKAKLLAEMVYIQTQIHDVAKLMTAKEIASIEE